MDPRKGVVSWVAGGKTEETTSVMKCSIKRVVEK